MKKSIRLLVENLFDLFFNKYIDFFKKTSIKLDK